MFSEKSTQELIKIYRELKPQGFAKTLEEIRKELADRNNHEWDSEAGYFLQNEA